jgi:hypothetical protein
MDHKKIISDIKGLKKEDMISEVKTAFNVAIFKKDVMAHVAADVNKTKFGYYIIAVGAILTFLGGQFFSVLFRPSILGGLIGAIVQAVMTVVGIYAVSYVATKFFKGAATHDQFFRVAAYGMILGWASLIPAVGMIVGIWGLAVYFVVLQTVHKLTVGGTIGTILVTLVAYWIVMMIIAMTGLSGMAGGFGGGSSFGSKSFNFGNSKKGASFDFSNGGMKINTPDGSIDFNIPNIK